MITFRRFTTADIQAGLDLCRIAGWNQVDNDWNTFLQENPESSSVAVDDNGRIAGTVTTINYGSFAWIGMLLVHPDFRKMGIGSSLLKEAMRIIGAGTTSRLDATPAGREVYLKLGFKDEYALIRMTRSRSATLQIGSTDPKIRIMTPDDLHMIKDFDRAAFGADRFSLLSNLLSSETAKAWVFEQDRSIKGYVFCRAGYDFSYAGPLIAPEFRIASSLISAAINHSQGMQLAIDIIDHSIQWRTFLESIGFVGQRPFIRMYYGIRPTDAKLDNVYAVAGPEYG